MVSTGRLAAFGFLMACTAPALAGGAASGTISNVFHVASYGGVVLFDTAGARTSPPSCQASATPQRWAINVGNISGQSALAALLTAISMHKGVQIIGTGTCSAWGDAETADWFVIAD